MRPGLLVAAAAAATIAAAGCGSSDNNAASGSASAEGPSGKVVMMLPNTTTPRFVQHDAPSFKAAMAKLAPKVKVEVTNADNDPNKQLAQAETAVTEGAKAIVLVAADPNLASGILKVADRAGVPVVAYEHEAIGGPLKYQVIFDPYKVGVAQGEYAAAKLRSGGPKVVERIKGNKGDNYTTQDLRGQDSKLSALITSGQVKVVCDDFTPNWDPANAQKLAEACLTKAPHLDAVVAMNDGTAGGAIAALKGAHLQGKVPVYGGQDADLSALQYILAGLQTSTVLKPFALEGQTAAKLVVAALTNSKPPAGVINGTFDNINDKPGGSVPTAYLPVQSVDASTMQRVVDAGLYSWQQICQGVAARSKTCEKKAGA
jgi:D-xylose transport system substrate-binding protein